MHVVMYKINYFSIIYSWKDLTRLIGMKIEGETHVKKKKKQNKKKLLNPFPFATWRSDLFSPIIQIPYIGTLRSIAHGQISSRATCELNLKIHNECLSGAFEILRLLIMTVVIKMTVALFIGQEIKRTSIKSLWIKSDRSKMIFFKGKK